MVGDDGDFAEHLVVGLSLALFLGGQFVLDDEQFAKDLPELLALLVLNGELETFEFVEQGLRLLCEFFRLVVGGGHNARRFFAFKHQ